jgi:hypothetical protein
MDLGLIGKRDKGGRGKCRAGPGRHVNTGSCGWDAAAWGRPESLRWHSTTWGSASGLVAPQAWINVTVYPVPCVRSQCAPTPSFLTPGVVAVFFDVAADACKRRVAARTDHPTIPQGRGARAVDSFVEQLQVRPVNCMPQA